MSGRCSSRNGPLRYVRDTKGRPAHERRGFPEPSARGVDDDTVEAVGSLSEALEYVERARVHLYSFTS